MVRHTRRSKDISNIECRNNENKNRKRTYKEAIVEIEPTSSNSPISSIQMDAHLIGEEDREDKTPLGLVKTDEATNVEFCVPESGRPRLDVTESGADKTEGKRTSITSDGVNDAHFVDEKLYAQNIRTKFKRRSGANTCMVLSCNSPRHPGIIYHGFPKSNHRELQKQWLITCGRSPDTSVLRHMRVCRYCNSIRYIIM